jgi:hypothetical protein
MFIPFKARRHTHPAEKPLITQADNIHVDNQADYIHVDHHANDHQANDIHADSL